MTDAIPDTQSTHARSEAGRKRANSILTEMGASRFHSWYWCVDGFHDALDWLRKHPHEVRNGFYLTVGAQREVWHIALPERLNAPEVVIKTFLNEKSFRTMFEESKATREARNYAVLRELGVPTANLLACYVERSLGMISRSVLVTEFVQNSLSGAALLPGAEHGQNDTLRMCFAQKALEILARTHPCNFFHHTLRPDKLLIRGGLNGEDDITLTCVDVIDAGFHRPGKNGRLAVARDILTLIEDLRLSTDEIRMLCSYYLDLNPCYDYTPDSLWKTLIALGHAAS